MNAKELWQQYLEINPRVARINCSLWKFQEVESILNGSKTATATPYALYGVKNEVPVGGEFAVVCDQTGEAACIVKLEEVYIQPYYRIGEGFAKKSGFASLDDWKNAQIPHIDRCLKAIGSAFNEGAELLCIEFRKVYPDESQV